MSRYPGEPGYLELRSGRLTEDGFRRELESSRRSLELYPRSMPLEACVGDLISRSLITDREVADYWLGTDPGSTLGLNQDHPAGTCLPLCASCNELLAAAWERVR